MSTRAPVEDEWDFYLCVVDGEPASIFLNLWYGGVDRIEGADTLYVVWIRMLSPADHGMGDDFERDSLGPVDGELGELGAELGLYLVGRVRTGGTWQLAFYGPPGQLERLHATCASVPALDGRRWEVRAQADPAWGYYHEFLYPDAERQRWMSDRQVVDVLIEHGDPLTKPRRVDHWAYFGSAADRDAFVADAGREGFELEGANDTAVGDRRFGAQVHRVDAVELDEIHAAVMTLAELAEQRGGEYDGWETPVERPDDDGTVLN